MKTETVNSRYKNTGSQEDRQVGIPADRQADKERAARQAAGMPAVDTQAGRQAASK